MRAWVQGSIERAMANVYDFQPFSSFFMKAAALLYSIILFHPYNDGNKRTAIMGTITFLNYNGYEFIASEDETFDMAGAIADRKVTDNIEIAKWIQKHSRRSILLMIYFLSLRKAIRTRPKIIPETMKVFVQEYPD